MSLIKILFCILSFASAGEFIEGGSNSYQKPEPYMFENISFKKMILLDKLTFDMRQIERLELNKWPDELLASSLYRDLSKAELKITKTREGHILDFNLRGPAHILEAYFGTALNMRLISAIHTKGGWVWNLPSEAYSKLWSESFRTTLNDIRTQAYIAWMKNPSVSTEVKEKCQLSLIY